METFDKFGKKSRRKQMLKRYELLFFTYVSGLNSGATVIETKSTTPQWTTGETVASRVRPKFIHNGE